MNEITQNPYRILGILADAGAKERTNRIKRLKQYIDAEQEPPQDDYSFPVLGKLSRTIHSVTTAESKLNLDHDKMLAALFWFYKGNDITDEPAFDALKSGDKLSAIDIWSKLVIDKEITAKNASAFHNLSVYLLCTEKPDFELMGRAIEYQLIFLESDSVQDFKSLVTDETYKITKKDLQLLFLNQLLTEIETHKTLTLNHFFKIINDISFSAKEDFIKNVSQKFVSKITAEIETARRQRAANKSNAATAGENLYKQTVNNLTHLKSIVGIQNFAYSTIADKVANEVLQCGIDYFNDSQEKELDNDYHKIAGKLLFFAEVIACGNQIMERIKTNINTMKEMKDREIQQAIELLKSIKNAYETNRSQVYQEAQFQKKSLKFGQFIDWEKVDKIIENSIDWSKVIISVRQVISPQNVEKIKKCKNSSKIKEYRELVDFLISKLVNANKYYTFRYLDQLTDLEKIEQELETEEQKLASIKNSTPFFSEIEIEESHLSWIKNTTFYLSEISKANHIMNEIRRFHLFRSKLEREKQIAEQQKIIAVLQDMSNAEKQKQTIEQEQKIQILRRKSTIEHKKQKENQQKIVDDLKIQYKNAKN